MARASPLNFEKMRKGLEISRILGEQEEETRQQAGIVRVLYRGGRFDFMPQTGNLGLFHYNGRRAGKATQGIAGRQLRMATFLELHEEGRIGISESSWGRNRPWTFSYKLRR